MYTVHSQQRVPTSLHWPISLWLSINYKYKLYQFINENKSWKRSGLDCPIILPNKYLRPWRVITHYAIQEHTAICWQFRRMEACFNSVLSEVCRLRYLETVQQANYISSLCVNVFEKISIPKLTYHFQHGFRLPKFNTSAMFPLVFTVVTGFCQKNSPVLWCWLESFISFKTVDHTKLMHAVKNFSLNRFSKWMRKPSE